MKNTPQLYQFPRMRGAITGEVIPAGQKCPMDDAPAVNEARVADFAAYRSGETRPIRLSQPGEVIHFPRRIPIDPDLIRSNVIYAFNRFPDPAPPTGAPAMKRAA